MTPMTRNFDETKTWQEQETWQLLEAQAARTLALSEAEYRGKDAAKSREKSEDQYQGKSEAARQEKPVSERGGKTAAARSRKAPSNDAADESWEWDGRPMTLRQLDVHLELLQELQQIRELRNALMDFAQPSSARLGDTPRGTEIRDRVGDLGAELADLDTQIRQKERTIRRREAMIERFVMSISDNQTRLVFRLRFLRGLSWGEVATMLGGRNSTDGVKKVCYRYLNRLAKR